MRNLKSLSILAVAAVLLGAPAAFADDGQGFSFNLDDLVVSINEYDSDDNSAKAEEYRDLDDGFQIRKLDISGASADHNRSMSLRLRRVGREDGRYTFDYGYAGRYGLMIDYNKIPHNFGYGGRTIYSRTGPGRYAIPDATQGFLQDSVLNASNIDFNFLKGLVDPLLTDAAPINIGLRRDRLRGEFGMADMKGFDWGVRYDHENRVGTRALGTSFGFNNVTELPEPIDYNTTRAEFKGEWNGDQAGMQFGYRYEKFENEIDTLVWDNPWRLIDSTDSRAYVSPSNGATNGPSRGLFDLAPDSDAGTLFVSGRARFGGSWNASGTLSLIRMEQDDSLQPYTTNTAIEGVDPHTGAVFDATTQPLGSANASADVLSFYGTVAGRFAERWSLKFKARYYDFENDSDHIEFPGYVRFDAVWEEIPRQTVNYAYTVTDLAGELGFDLSDNSRLGLLYTYRSWDRDFREIEESTEDIVKLFWDGSFGAFGLRASYEMADRSISEYMTEAQEYTFVEPEGINNQPGLRKFDEAERESDILKLQGTWMISDRLDLTFGYIMRDDDYPDSLFGLVSDDVDTAHAEISYAFPGKGSFYAFYEYQDREVFQRARQSGGTLSTSPLDDWEGTFGMTNDLFGIGLNLDGSSPWKFGAHVTWTESDGTADLFSPPGGVPNTAEGFGDYEDIELFTGKVKVGYAMTEQLETGVTWWYEDYTYSSFLTRGLQNYLPGALLINGNNGDYSFNIVSLYFRLKM